MTEKTKPVDPNAIPDKQREQFAGQGGSFYFNPAGSATLKRDRNHDVPFTALSAVDQAKRILALPADRISDHARAERIKGLNLTAEQHEELNKSAAVATTGAPPEASASGAATAAASATKKGGK